MKYTRNRYMSGEVSHSDYYGQFVGASLRHDVGRIIGVDRIKSSEDPHFNDIPLKEWDNMTGLVRVYCGRAIADASGTGGISLSDTVCIAKEAARQIKAV